MTTLILTALERGMNIKLLLIVTGLDEATFRKYVDDDLFNTEQRIMIRRLIKEWEGDDL